MDQVIQTAAETNLTLLTKRASRFQGGDKPSALDLILSNTPNNLDQIVYLNSSSDHMIITCRLRLENEKPKPKTRRIRSYKHYSQESFKNLARQWETSHILESNDANEIADSLNNIINNILDEIAPFKTITPRIHYAQYLTPETREMMKIRNQKKKEANNTQKEEDKKMYRQMRNQTTKEIKQDKKKWLKQQMESSINSSKELWQAANKVMGKTTDNTIEEINNKGETTND